MTKKTLSDWAELAQKELRTSPETLIWQTPEGIAVKPLYTAEDLDGAGHLDSLPGFSPFTRGPRATMYAGRPRRSANMPASRRQRNRMPFIAAIWPPARRACRSPSILPPTAVTTAIIRASRAMSARRVWQSTASRT